MDLSPGRLFSLVHVANLLTSFLPSLVVQTDNKGFVHDICIVVFSFMRTRPEVFHRRSKAQSPVALTQLALVLLCRAAALASERANEGGDRPPDEASQSVETRE